MALNVLLVDDEYLVLKGLEIILREQTEVELKIVAVMDASEALEKLDSYRPDVVITDINMPEVNGFTMIEQIRSRYPRCHFIICSGYDEYDYLKQALRLHIADYLMKPVDKSLLIRRLRELAAEKEKHISHILLRIQLLLFKGQNSSKTDFSVKELEQIFPDPAFCLCAVNTFSSDTGEIRRLLTQYFDTVYVFALNSRTIYLLNYPEKIQTDGVRSILSGIMGNAFWGCSFFTSVSGKTDAIGAISVRYQEAVSEMVLSLLPDFTDIQEHIRQSLAARTLFPAIRVITFECSIEDYIQELCEATPKKFCYPLIFTEIFSAYLLVSDINLPADLIRQFYQPQPDASLRTKKALVNLVKKILNCWYDSFSQSEHASSSPKIASACRYIDAHYQEDLSLDQIAEMLSMNSSYLSYIFKKETGSTLVQYLTNVRMQQACRLLQTQPELSLDEIAVSTGYHSTTYFHKIFRARFGVSPRQWQLANGLPQAKPPQ